MATTLDEYVHAVARAARCAFEASGCVIEDLRLGGVRVRLAFAGPALLTAVLPPLRHLRIEPGDDPPSLTVELWDAASTHVPAPPVPWRDDLTPRPGDTRHSADGSIRILFPGGASPRDGALGEVTTFERDTRTARCFVGSPERIPWYERAAPLRAVLQWGLADLGRLLVHGAAVGRGDHGLLLTGPKGSGKSTIAVAAALAGLDYLGDDYMVVLPDEVPAIAHSLYCVAKLDPSSAPLLPALSPPRAGGLAPGEKRIVDVAALRPESIRASVPLTAIVVPRRGRTGQTTLRPASAGAAMLALAPSTVFQAPAPDGDALAPLAGLIRRLRAYTLEWGEEPGRAAQALATLCHPR